MKHNKSIFFGILATFSASFALMTIARQPTENSRLSLKNLQAMEASAGELKCDGKNQTACGISYPGEPTYNSKGYLSYVP